MSQIYVQISDIFAPMRNRLWSVLAAALLVLMLLLTVVLLFVKLLPEWRLRRSIVEQVRSAEVLLQRQEQAPQPDKAALGYDLLLLESKVERAQRQFISETEADAFLTQLYEYAVENGVSIEQLELQPPPKNETQPHLRFRVEVLGPMSQLFRFVSRIHEASSPRVMLDGMTIYSDDDAGTAVLNMEMMLYTLPEIKPPPTPTPPPTATPEIDPNAPPLLDS